MSVQVMLFSAAAFLFMLLVMCCGSGGVVCAEKVNSVSQPNSVELFKKGETKVSESGTDVNLFSAHSLVDVNGLMVALAEAHSNCGGWNHNIEIWSKSLRYENDTMPSEIITEEDRSQRMAQAAATKKAGESSCTQLSGPSAVVKDNKIYIVLSNSRTYSRDREIVVGTVETPTDGTPSKITWQPSKSLKDTLKDKLPDGSSWDDLFVAIGRGIVVDGSTILFPLALHNFDIGGKIKCTVIYSEDNGDNWNFPLGKIIDEDCQHATLLGWEGKLLMITTSFSSRTRKVHVSADKGKTWAEDGESGPSLLVDILKRVYVAATSDIISTTISGRNVTLLSHQRFIPWSGTREVRVQDHLLMTDNKRITSVGPISLGTDTYSACKLLHKEENGGLFALCNKGSRYSPESVVLFSLTEQLERIKSVLETWEVTDGKVSKICISTETEKEMSYNTCRGYMPTRGLIGFLSNTSDSTHWADEYLGVNATVTGGTKVENGFKLSGSGAKVEWEIGNEYRTPLYSFADLGLTLVATVTIHGIPESDTPLMSVALESKVVGLWYGKENHWKGLSDGKENASWEKGKPYQVAITLLKGTASVYIDGKRLGGLEPNFRPNKVDKARRPRHGVSHELKEEVKRICFGNCLFMHNDYWNNAGSSFTVTNVFLHNRVLNATELLPPPPAPPQQQQEQEQSQSTAEETGEVSITGNSTDEKRADQPPKQEQEQSQTTAKETGESTTTSKPTDEKRTDTAPAGKNGSVHESLSSLFHLFSLLVFLGSATLL